MLSDSFTCIQKIDKLIPRLEGIIETRQSVGINLTITQAVDDFFYRQKIAELKLLKEKLSSGDRPTIANVSDIIFMNAFKQWKNDVRMLNKFFISANKHALGIQE